MVARGGNGDADRTLAVCDRLKSDRDDMVVKAMSSRDDGRSMIALRRATLDDLDRLQHWDWQPHVIAADPNDEPVSAKINAHHR